MKIGESEIEIYFDDLSEEAQKEFLKAMKMESESDGNYEAFPIAVVPIPEFEERMN